MRTIKITYRKMVAEFLSFLKENNALNRYQNAVKKQKRLYFETIENNINLFTIDPIKRLFNPREYCQLINRAFHWSSTPEGHTYWEELDRKWRRRIEGIEFKIVNEKIYEE